MTDKCVSGTGGVCVPKPEKRLPPLQPDSPEADQELARLAKALGHPVRVQIVRILARRTTCVCGELVDELPVSQSTVSQHLKCMKEAGLVQGAIDGPRVCYCISPAVLERLKLLVGAL